jgi:hypothetical protein
VHFATGAFSFGDKHTYGLGQPDRLIHADGHCYRHGHCDAIAYVDVHAYTAARSGVA